MSEQQEYLTIDEVAKMLRIVPGTLHNWRSTGKFKVPSYKPGGQILFRRSEVEEYVNSTRHETTAELS